MMWLLVQAYEILKQIYQNLVDSNVFVYKSVVEAVPERKTCIFIEFLGTHHLNMKNVNCESQNHKNILKLASNLSRCLPKKLTIPYQEIMLKNKQCKMDQTFLCLCDGVKKALYIKKVSTYINICASKSSFKHSFMLNILLISVS